MYISSRDTIAEAFEAFKSYPKIKQLILYNLIPLGLMFAIVFVGGIGAYNASTEMQAAPLLMMLGVVGLCGMIAAIAFYYISYVHVMNYYQNGRVFADLSDFLKPQQSIFRLFWKATILPVLIVLIAVAVMSGFSYAAAGTGAGAGAILSAIVAIAMVAFFIWAVPKFTIIVAYLVANTTNGLRDSFAFSKGYYWYLTRILFWVSLIYIAVEIIYYLLIFIGNLVLPELFASGWDILVNLAYLASFALIYIFWAFVYCNAYIKINEARASK